MNHLFRPALRPASGLFLAAVAWGLIAGCSSADKAAEETDGGRSEAPALAPEDLQIPEDGVGGIGILRATADTYTFVPGSYLRPSPAHNIGALIFDGLEGLTLDFSGVELRGQVAGTDIDAAAGYGIVLRNCTGVTLKGGLFGGYKIPVLVDGGKDVTVDSARFDGWFGQRLRSTRYVEDLTDWLRPQENDAQEWNTRYGGAISAQDTSGLTVRGCRGRRGQNGILLARVKDSQVYDNDFSFLSGWGIALYRSSRNVISHNVCDYCVRGYSHDVYWRGQDSAGILMFEGSCENLIARNSATHSGDGVFLYAGNDVVERGATGASGSNDNIFFENDLSFAVANSLEATFSQRNAVIGNKLSGSHQHGVWGGYSSEMLIRDNEIQETLGTGIAIEHGQDCVIAGNEISRNEVAVKLYWDEDPQFVDGPYGRRFDTSSRDHYVLKNNLESNVLDFVIRTTTGFVVHGNSYLPGSREPYFEGVSAEADPTLNAKTVHRWLDALDGKFPSGNLSSTTLNPWTGQDPELLAEWQGWTPPEIPGSQVIDAAARDEFGGGLESIVMGEFGPWDFRSGAPRPKERKPGGLLAQATWNATWFRWAPGTSDPRTAERAWRNQAAAPILRAEVDSFINPWASDENKRIIGNEFFGLFGATNVILDQSGSFDLSVVSDDGIRVYIDEELVIDNWTLHAAERNERTIKLDRGEHIVRFEYFQIQDAAALVLDMRPH